MKPGHQLAEQFFESSRIHPSPDIGISFLFLEIIGRLLTRMRLSFLVRVYVPAPSLGIIPKIGMGVPVEKRNNADLLFLVLGGYFDIDGMDIVGLLGVERNHCETATDIPSLNAGRLLRTGGVWLRLITGYGDRL